LPALRFAKVRRRADGAGGFFLINIRWSFRKSPLSGTLPIMFSEICAALIGQAAARTRRQALDRRRPAKP
jgi:hypothetical protein